MATWDQWRIVAGPGFLLYEGIDHACLLGAMEMLGVKKSKRRDAFLYVRILQNEAKPLRNERD